MERKDKKVRQLKVDSSIYNMALYTLIDPAVIEEYQRNKFKDSPDKTKILPVLDLNDTDKDGIFFGLCIVVGL